MKPLGMTLVEILLAAAAAVAVGALLVGILAQSSGFYYKENAIIREGLSLNDVVHRIDENIREALSVASGYPEASPQFSSGAETLVLKLPSLSGSGTVSGIYDFVVITKDSTNPKILRMKVFPDEQSQRPSADTVLTVILDSIQFRYLDKNGAVVTPVAAFSVGTTLTAMDKTGTIGSSRTTSIVTTLRNN